jgi:fatty acid/phospholipid biosynthesis enzyme
MICGTCKSCSQPFCADHASLYDPALCTVCVAHDNTKIDKQPLIDTEGVKHQGTKLVLTGEAWMRSRDVISKMTDVELESKLTALKNAVHEAEMILDYRRIIHSQAENEKEARHTRKTRRRMLIEAVDDAHKANKISATDASARIEVAKDALKSLNKLGLNKDAIANVLLMLAKQKEKPKTP